MLKQPLTAMWISEFPVEWLPDLPEPLRTLPRRSPGTWQIALLSEFEKCPGLRLHVVVLRKRLAHDFSFTRNGVVFHLLKVPSVLRPLSLFWLDTFRIRRICRQIRPDVIHAWGSERGAALIAMRLGYPAVATVQGLLSWYREVVPLALYERLMERLERLSLARSRVVSAESIFTVDYIRSHFRSAHVEHVEHVPNWLFHRVLRRPQTDPIHFLSLATLGYRKGTDLLLRALDRLSGELEFKLTIICGQNRDYLETLRPELSAGIWRRIEFKSGLDPGQVADAMTTPTILLLPTRADTGPMAVKEAAVAGMPVVASRIGGTPDYIVPGKNGDLFPSGNLEAFLHSIQAACRHPLFSKGCVDSDTLARTRAYLSPERMAQRFLEVYDFALNTTPVDH